MFCPLCGLSQRKNVILFLEYYQYLKIKKKKQKKKTFSAFELEPGEVHSLLLRSIVVNRKE